LDCPYIDSTTQKPYTGTRKTTCHKKTFSPTAAFEQKWNNARNNYLQKDKSYYDATQKHSSSIAKSNMAAKGFKDEIDELAKVKVKECDVGRKVGVLADVKEFNTQNTNRAIFFRSVEVIKCHVKSMHKSATVKSKKNSKLNTCIAKVKSEAWLKKHKFKDISKPIKFCPSVQEYRNELKLKYGMDLHYTGKTDAIVTDTQGVVSTKYGWYPRTKQCADVKKRATLDTPNKFTATFQDANGVKGGTYKFAFVPMPSETTCSKSATHRHRFLSRGDYPLTITDYLFKVCEAVGMKVLCDAGPGSVLDCSKNPRSVYIGTYTTPAGGYASNTYKFVNTPKQLHNAPSGSSSMKGVSKTSWFPSGWKAVQSKFDRANLCYFYGRNGGMCSLKTKSGNKFDRGWNYGCYTFMKDYTVTDDNQRVVCVKKM